MKIVIISGSNREGASTTLLSAYVGQVLTEKGAEVTLVDLYKQPVPLYSPDPSVVEDENLVHMKQTVMEADGIVLATPEYHGAMSGVLKNALDHMDAQYVDGKVVLSMSSAGGAVGVSSLQQLQTVVRNLHGINCPEWISIGGAGRTFNEQGEPETLQIRERILRTVTYFLSMTETFRKSV
ncbi:NADPH-dependent FMN reductase [Paenibacillus chitinolyticus]|uniref:NADPH-dependent FMN reductase n=1 Tax=Paenibacillus chitinolyticus TaxID=79263 RepID=UPI0036488DD7